MTFVCFSSNKMTTKRFRAEDRAKAQMSSEVENELPMAWTTTESKWNNCSYSGKFVSVFASSLFTLLVVSSSKTVSLFSIFLIQSIT